MGVNAPLPIDRASLPVDEVNFSLDPPFQPWSFLLHDSYDFFSYFKQQKVGNLDLWCSIRSAEINPLILRLDVSKIVPLWRFSSGSVSQPKFLYELRIGRGEGERPQALDGISQPWPVILMPKTVQAGIGGDWAARRRFLFYRDRDMVFSSWGTR